MLWLNHHRLITSKAQDVILPHLTCCRGAVAKGGENNGAARYELHSGEWQYDLSLLLGLHSPSVFYCLTIKHGKNGLKRKDSDERTELVTSDGQAATCFNAL